MKIRIGENEYEAPFKFLALTSTGQIIIHDSSQYMVPVASQDIESALNELYALRQDRDALKKRVEELEETLEDMASQFAHQSVIKGKRFVTTGGLSALESCFSALGWGDPHSANDLLQGCDYPGCNEFASCGTPTPDGYKNCCGIHYREYNKPKGGDNEV